MLRSNYGIQHHFRLVFFFQTTKLRLWRLERQRKCLVWQKRYLQAVLQNMEIEGGQCQTSLCKSSCNCTSGSSDGHSISFEKPEPRKQPPKFRYLIFYVKFLKNAFISRKKRNLAERSFDLRTSGLWAQHASTAPLCFACFVQ